MAEPSTKVEESKAANAKNSSNMSFPGDIENVKYFTKLRFVKYQRTRPADNVTEQTTGTVILPLPERLPDNYSLGWTGTSLGLFGGSFHEYMQAVDALKNAGSSLAEYAQNIGSSILEHDSGKFMNAVMNPNRQLAATALVLSPKYFQDSQIGQAIQNSFGIVPNPHMTSIFTGVELKTYDFSWTLSPRGSQDAQALQRILRFIKVQSHPSHTAGTANFALDYPDQLYITFEGTSYVEAPQKCVVKAVHLEMADNGPAFFKDGVPIFTRLALQVQEVDIRTRETWTGNTSSNTASSTVSTGNPDSSIKAGPR